MTADLVLVANSGDSTIGAYTLTPARGSDLNSQPRLEHLVTSPVGRGCSTFVVDEARSLVYAAAKPETDGASPTIDTFALDRSTGRLTRVHRREVEGGMNYLALTPDGRVLAGAAYHDGFAATWTVDEDGQLSPQVDRVDWLHAHCVIATPGQLYVVSLGADVIAQYALSATGALAPLDLPIVPAPKGSGPRHLVLDETLAHAYVVTEFSGEVLSFDRSPGTGELTATGADPAYALDRDLTHSRLGADPKAEHLIWGADLHLARGGTFVLASERTESTLACLPVDRDGVAGAAVGLIDTVAQPRGFAVSPDGRYAVVAGEAGTELQLVSIGRDGALREVARVASGAKANWVRILAR